MPRIRSFARHLIEDELSYSLSRPYGLGRGFKGWVLLGSIVLFGILTVFNLATNGFDKQLRYTTDPNSTEANREWYNTPFFTWGDDSLEPKCQNTEIPVGHEFITTNLGLRYTVRSILYFPPGSDNGEERPSISYHNNTLTHCHVNTINISLKKAALTKPENLKKYQWWSWLDSSAEAVARCDIINDDGLFTLEFLAKYYTADEYYGYVAVTNATTHASLWWGTRLLNAYFVGTKYFMSDVEKRGPITRATLTFSNTSTTSMKDTKLFRNTFFFLDDVGGVRDHLMPDLEPERVELYNNPSIPESRALTEGFFFAKIFRSLILVDLGNSTAPNLLLNPDLLQYALNPADDDFNRIPGAPLMSTDGEWFKFNAIPPPGQPLEAKTAEPLNNAYAKFKDQTGKLETKNASIYAQYICAVPGPKPISAMVLFALVANLALFQTAWALFKYVLDRKVTWKDPSTNWCEGCLANNHGLVTIVNEDKSADNVKKTKRSYSIGSSSTGRLLGEENGYY
jgi:hypothetical protein